MSKIPQGEWNAIAARYAQGESISRIAQSYGCTPPAIHYILKRNEQRTSANITRSQSGQSAPAAAATIETSQTSAAPALSRSTGPLREDWRRSRPAPSEVASAEWQTSEFQTHDDPALVTIGSIPSGQGEVAPQQQQLGKLYEKGGAGSAIAAGLDRELHGRAEAAIEAFCSSFDAALIEGSPIVRQRLRQAASDLMRVAARTTIVLDRLNASAERGSTQGQSTPRFVHPRDHA